MHLNEDRKRCKQNDKENVVDNIYLTSSQSTLEAVFAEVQGEIMFCVTWKVGGRGGGLAHGWDGLEHDASHE